MAGRGWKQSFTFCFSLSPAQTLDIHTWPFPSEQSTAAVQTEAQNSMGESWSEHKSCSLLRWEVEGNMRGLMRIPWKFIPPHYFPLKYLVWLISAWRQYSYKAASLKGFIMITSLKAILGMLWLWSQESATLALSVHFSLNSMWPT